jgi:hypothetical protein
MLITRNLTCPFCLQHQLALEDAQKSVEVDPAFFKGFMRIGHSLVALGRHQQAIDDGFERALRLQPDDQAAKEALAAARTQAAALPDLLNNPALRQMAQNMPAEMPAGLEGLMNPEMMRMAMARAVRLLLCLFLPSFCTGGNARSADAGDYAAAHVSGFGSAGCARSLHVAEHDAQHGQGTRRSPAWKVRACTKVNKT